MLRLPITPPEGQPYEYVSEATFVDDRPYADDRTLLVVKRPEAASASTGAAG
jgi:hypothetical protein